MNYQFSLNNVSGTDLMRVGSLCSGIEAASAVWGPLGFEFAWFSEIEDYPSDILRLHYPKVKNLGDMCRIPDLLKAKEIETPDLICSGTPCQAFSVTGYRDGMEDDRGQLTVKFVEIIDANDINLAEQGKEPTILFWENVEGVLSDKTNAFGIMISTLAGLDFVIEQSRWENAGLIRGPKRNIAWRVIDAKYFGLPQQRKRVYLLGGGKDFHPENILFEKHLSPLQKYPKSSLTFTKDGTDYEVFREYVDCLYAAYGTKWNGNAAAYNGSLYVVENNRLRRFTPRECEKLMGFPPDYTKQPGVTRRGDFTSRYKAIGNSWAVPVINWIGSRILSPTNLLDWNLENDSQREYQLYQFSDIYHIDFATAINCSEIPEKPIIGKIEDIVEKCDYHQLFLSPTACHGILRRSSERGVKINPRLKEIMSEIANSESIEEIERKSRVQPRGEFSLRAENDTSSKAQMNRYNKDNINDESTGEGVVLSSNLYSSTSQNNAADKKQPLFVSDRKYKQTTLD